MNANEEQLIAIKQVGNTCLFAGAGAGKTYVITEHLYKVLNDQIKEMKKANISGVELDRKIRILFSSHSVITFTKKAAREIKERVKKRFEQELNSESSQGVLIRKHFSKIRINTIHGFFFKILKENTLDSTDLISELSDELEIKAKIENFLDSYLEEHRSNAELVKLINWQKTISSSLYQVISEPDFEKNWIHDEANLRLSAEDILPELFLIKDAWDFLPAEHLKEKDKKWFQLFEGFHTLISKVESISDVVKLFVYLKKTRFSFPRGKLAETFNDQIETIKCVDQLRKDYFELCLVLDSGNSEHIQKWKNLYRELVKATSVYLKARGIFGFSDIERMLLRALKSETFQEKVSKQIGYLLIDEYQDTSWVQYEIIKKLISEDYSKLYIVGDPKQAIYSFRGGEVDVFFKTANFLGSKLSLRMNYRSTQEVINFNNKLFESILSSIGRGSSNSNKNELMNLEVSQVFGNDSLGRGQVNLISSVRDVEKSNVAVFERKLILEHLEAIISREGFREVAVLVRKVSHGVKLAKDILKRGLEVSFQLKIPAKEAPLIVYCNCLLELITCEKDKFNGVHERLERNLTAIELKINLPDAKEVKQLKERVDLFGFLSTFRVLVSNLPFYKREVAIQEELLGIIYSRAKGNLETFWKILKFDLAGTIDLRIQNSDAPVIHFLTVHASKGLEFQNVVMAGFYEAQKANVFGGYLGKTSNHFYFPHPTEQEMIKTSEAIRSAKKEQTKSINEGKRLFYVACTRAIESLSFVRLSEVKSPKGSWMEYIENELHALEPILNKIEYDFEEEKIVKSPLNTNFNFFGIEDKTSNFSKEALTVFPEVSVSKISDLVTCPKYFYLKNVLRLEPQESTESSVVDTPKNQILSSAERGTEIHQNIEKFVQEFSESSLEVDEKWPWYFKRISKYADSFILYPEKEVKFEVFGQMISGTIDLLCISDEKIKIVDYKTGALNHIQNSKYFFQVLLYAKSQLVESHKYKSIEVELWYLDLAKGNDFAEEEKAVLNYQLFPNDIDDAIAYYQSKLFNYSQKNTFNCTRCYLRNVCL